MLLYILTLVSYIEKIKILQKLFTAILKKWSSQDPILNHLTIERNISYKIDIAMQN